MDRPVGELQSGMNFVFERRAEDGLAALARPRGVSRLDHEPFDYSMNDAVVVVSFLLL